MLGYNIYLGAVLLIMTMLYLMGRSKYAAFVEEYKSDFKFSFLAPMSLVLIDKFKIMQRLSSKVTQMQQKIIQIYDYRKGNGYTKMHLAEMISLFFIVLMISAIFGVAADGDITIIVFGIILAILFPLLLNKQLDDKVKERREDIILDLPEFVNKLVLLANAGLNIEKAMVRVVNQEKNWENSYLYRELKEVVAEINNNGDFSAAMERFNQRCRVQEVSIFSSTLLLNYNRGSELVIALRSLSKELWEKRKMVAKVRGEQASTKLVIPMVIIFLVVLVIVGYPAMALM